MCLRVRWECATILASGYWSLPECSHRWNRGFSLSWHMEAAALTVQVCPTIRFHSVCASEARYVSSAHFDDDPRDWCILSSSVCVGLSLCSFRSVGHGNSRFHVLGGKSNTQGRCGASPRRVTVGVMIHRILRWTFPMNMMSNHTCSDRPLPTCKTSIVVTATICTLFKANTQSGGLRPPPQKRWRGIRPRHLLCGYWLWIR